jgi:energy-coupling factor transporter ATP-binding protein EcfA2
MNLSSIEFMMKEFAHLKEIDTVRKIIGRYGISGKQQAMPIRCLSDGQRCRVALAWVAHQTPHMLMLDEPTNHLDLESIDALANAIKNYNGGLVLVSHDFRLISQVAKEIWICEKQTVTPWTGTIQAYKEILKNNVLGKDGKKKDMAAASADHYNKVEVPAAIKKVKAPVKKMSILNITSNKKASPASSPATAGVPKKFVPPGKRGDAKPAGNEGEDWW